MAYDLTKYAGAAAVVSGGGDGIGRSLALALAGAQMDVAVLDIRQEAADSVAAEIAALGVRSLAIACDVSQGDQVSKAARQCRDALGQPRIVWSNAGVGAMGGLLEMPIETIEWIMAVNVMGMIHVVREFGAPLKTMEGPRHIGLTASISGLTQPGPHIATYGMSKFAVVGMGEVLRAELGDSGVGVSIVCPGLINTNIWNATRSRPDRFGGAEDVPDAVGDRWREHGMSADWVAKEAMAAIAAGGGYVCPVDPHSLDDYNRRHAEIMASFRHP
jgi:NAD(P)-dependent dehydrogenase (short-subunit alcohol dehydrogenase family)